MPVLLFTGHRLDAADRPDVRPDIRFSAAMVPGGRVQIAAAIAAGGHLTTHYQYLTDYEAEAEAVGTAG
ncbi:MAG: hypothetical protein H7330_01675 [Hymenobacteraceae bacterium]|nr:hypothetical protein [Hymenobacteraceae bacterium]